MTDAPSAIKSSATRKSAAGQSRAGRWRPNSTIAATTTATLAVWPTAHATPRRQASRSRPWRVASVETAARWSGSNAWRNPSRRPRPARARRPGEPGVMAAANVAYSSGRIMEPGMIAASERRALEGIHARYAPVDARVAEILENIRRDRRAQPPQLERRLPRDGHRRREARRGAGRGAGRLGRRNASARSGGRRLRPAGAHVGARAHRRARGDRGRRAPPLRAAPVAAPTARQGLSSRGRRRPGSGPALHLRTVTGMRIGPTIWEASGG